MRHSSVRDECEDCDAQVTLARVEKPTAWLHSRGRRRAQRCAYRQPPHDGGRAGRPAARAKPQADLRPAGEAAARRAAWRLARRPEYIVRPQAANYDDAETTS